MNTFTLTLETVQELRFQVEAGESTLKMAKEKLIAIFEGSHESQKEALKMISASKSKKAFFENCEELEMLDIPVVKDDKVTQLVNAAHKIEQLLSDRAANTLALGETLSTIKGLLSSSKEFLEWAKLSCGLSKSQVLKWVKIWDTFGGEPMFKGISMRVMYDLSTIYNGTPEQQAAYNECLDIIDAYQADGGAILDSGTLQKIRVKHETPAPVAPALPPAPKGGLSLVEGDETNTDNIDGTANVQPIAGLSVEKDDKKTEQEQLSLILELKDTIASLTDQLRLAKAPVAPAKPVIRDLPQFKSKNPCVVLGLDPEFKEDSKAIKSAYRVLAGIFSEGTNPEAAEALASARDTLLA